MILFDQTFMRRLEQLSLVIRRIRGGRGQGEHRSHRRGISVEFADYRDYTPGDDLRHLDWHIYARLERPFIKLFEEEEDLNLHVILDASGSMNWPEDAAELNKWHFGRRLAAALSYVALANGDRLTFSHVRHERPQLWPTRRGRGHIHTLLKYLDTIQADGPTDLNKALYQLTIGAGRQSGSLVFIISDFFSEGYERGLAALRSAGHEVNVLHLLSPDEIEPTLNGDLQLYDVETGLAQEVTIDADLRQLYQQKFAAWREGIEQYCFSHDINYINLNTAHAFEGVILGHLRQRGFVR